METYLIAGLGNPGTQYDCTRHNAGFMALDILAEHLQASWQNWQGAKAQYAKTSWQDKTVFLLKPLTYMNLSGTAVSSVANFYKIKPQNIIIIFDEMSLPLGSIRLKLNGSAGGHNGMQHIIDQLGTQNIVRLRIGIGPKPSFFEGKDFVLSKFSKQELPLLKQSLQKTLTALEKFFSAGGGPAMTIANAK